MRNGLNENSIQKRHILRQKKRRRAQLIRRTVSLGTLGVILLCIIVFFTPLFNIRSVTINGNSKIETEQIEQKLGVLTGENLFLTRSGRLEDNILSLSYADKVSVKKGLFPPSVTIEITEREPIAYLLHNSSFVIIDISGRILEVSEQKADLTELAGLKLTAAAEGTIISLDDNGKLKTVLAVLEQFNKSGLMSGVTVINLEDLDNITFNYQNRLDGICGPYVDFSRKLSLFREAITSNRLTENTRGTIDLATKKGHAIYRP